MNAQVALSKLQIPFEQVLCVYLRGSQAVGYANTRADGSPSDWDLVIVVRNGFNPPGEENTASIVSDVHISHDDVDGAIYDEYTFRRLLHCCCIWVMECIFAPKHCIWKSDIDFVAEFQHYVQQEIPRVEYLASLRESVSYEANRQWAKAKRILTKDGDDYGCRKRMFISIRFLVYGIELSETNAIRDISCANAEYWFGLLKDLRCSNWKEYVERAGPVFAGLKTKFKQLTPKQLRYGGYREQVRKGKKMGAASVSFSSSAALSSTIHTTTTTTTTTTAIAIVDHLRHLTALHHGNAAAALSWVSDNWFIQCQPHSHHPHVVQLRYSPRSPRDNVLVNQCRGLILDTSADWKILAYPFDRFFDVGETSHGDEGNLDWSRTRVYSKMDGSLAILYRLTSDGPWHVASSRHPDGETLMCLRDADGPVKFKDLFWRAWSACGNPPFDEDDDDDDACCYMFELTSPHHTIVVRHAEEQVTLVGARSLKTMRELDPIEISMKKGWKGCAVHEDLNNRPKEEIIAAAKQLNGRLHEGFVVVDAQYNRVKVKSPDYIQYSWMFPICPNRSGLNKRHMLMVSRAGEAQEFIVYCPEFKNDMIKVQEELMDLEMYIQHQYKMILQELGIDRRIEDKPTRKIASKDFARLVVVVTKQPKVIQMALFHLWNSGAPASDFITTCSLKILEDALEFMMNGRTSALINIY